MSTRLPPVVALTLLVGLAWPALADSIDPAALTALNEQRLSLNLTGMKVLGGVGAASLASGLALGFRGSPSQRAFHLMNAGWGAVDLGLALTAGLAAAATDPATMSLADAVADARWNQNLFLLNAGLDVAYVAFGLWMADRARRGDDKAAFYRGAGPSVMLQGGFLLAFDLTMFALHRRENGTLDAMVRAATGH